MEHTREKPAYMHYLLLCNITCSSSLMPYMHQKEPPPPTKKKVPTHSFYVCFSRAQSNRRIVNMELTADNYSIQHLRSEASAGSC